MPAALSSSGRTPGCPRLAAGRARASAAGPRLSAHVDPRISSTSASRSTTFRAGAIAERDSGEESPARPVPAAWFPPKTPSPPSVLAIFVSGGGSNAAAIERAIADGRIPATVGLVVASAPGCGAAERARADNVPVVIYPPVRGASLPSLRDETPGNAGELVGLLRAKGVTHVILAGYLKLVPPEVLAAYPRKVLNVHPGLLPSFGGHGMYGERVHAAVIASGARISGPTVHFVDARYDEGKILAQATVPVHADDTPSRLAARVLKVEHQLLPRCVAALVEGRIGFRPDGVPVEWEAKVGGL